MNLEFRPATLADLPALLPLMKEMQLDDPWSIPFVEAEATRSVEQLLGDPSFGRLWLISADGATVGYVVMSFDFSLEYRGRNAWVDELFVRSTHRGQGIGKRALEFFEAQAKELGVTVMHLEVNHGNPAIDLYRRLGYEDHHRYLMSKWIIPKP